MDGRDRGGRLGISTVLGWMDGLGGVQKGGDLGAGCAFAASVALLTYMAAQNLGFCGLRLGWAVLLVFLGEMKCVLLNRLCLAV